MYCISDEGRKALRELIADYGERAIIMEAKKIHEDLASIQLIKELQQRELEDRQTRHRHELHRLRD